MGEPTVKFSEGKIKGIVGQNICGTKIYKFLGVPYAKPPIGDLRFKAPEPVEPWDGIKDATKDGSQSVNRDLMQEDLSVVNGSEDCLVLNVFTRNIEPTKNLKPVMVYIHGGGFTMGSNNSEVLGPDFLLIEDIVLVVINYRLGALGFLSLEDESLNIPGNAGLKDQTMALKWVQKNIKQFGGDPDNVTIFGESAGSVSVHFHVLSPASKGLFHKAILQSGVVLSYWSYGSTNGHLLAEALGKKDASDKEVFNTLQKMTGKEVFLLQEKLSDNFILATKRPFVPVIEKPNASAFLTKSPFELIASGEYNHVPLLIGYTSHEGLLLEFIKKKVPDCDSTFTYQLALPWFIDVTGEQNEKIVKLMSDFYSKLKEPERKQMIMMDSAFLSGIAAVIKGHSKTSKQPIYVYRASVDFNRNLLKQTAGLQEFKGCCHADELGYLFSVQGLPKIEHHTPPTPEFLTVQRFVKLWTNFAKSGNPTPNNDFGITLSPVKNGDQVPMLDIGEKLQILTDIPERDRVELWRQIFNYCKVTANIL